MHLNDSYITLSTSVIDSNGDDYLDILVWHNMTKLDVFLNDGTGHFREEKNYFMQDFETFSYLAAGVNDDRRADVIMYGAGFTSINVYLQNEDETFATPLVSSIDHQGDPTDNFYLNDINNDTIPDLLLIPSFDVNITIVLGQGNGTFQHTILSTNLPVFFYPLYAFNDINRDGQLDVVFSIAGQGLLYVFVGLGNGSFINVRNFTTKTGLDFASMTLKDMNNDQNSDILTIDATIGSLTVRYGDGQGGFVREDTYRLQMKFFSVQLIAGDFNGDSKMDLAIVCSDEQETRIYHGDGSGRLIPENHPLAISLVGLLEIGDFNRDGRLDWILFANRQGSLMFGYDAGTLINLATYDLSSASRPPMISTGDFNHDQHWDLLVVNVGQNSFTVQLGHGDGTFADGMTYSIGDRSFSQALAIGDLNRDQLSDLAVINAGTHGLAVFNGGTNGRFAIQSTLAFSIESYPSSITAAHLNEDDWLDLAVTTNTPNQLNVFFGYKYPRLIEQTPYQMSRDLNLWNIVMADLNDDRRMDITVFDVSRGALIVLLGDGKGNFVDPLTFLTDDNNLLLNLVAANMDGNNQTDLVYGISASSTIIIFLNFNQSSWSEIISYKVNSDSFGNDVFVADLNDDGYSDLIILIYENVEVRAVLNNGNKTFATPATFFLTSECRPATLFVGRLNHDLYSDLIFISSARQSFCIYLGNGDGTFNLSSIQPATISDDVNARLCADLNNDGLSDLVIAYYNSPGMDIFLHQNDALMTMAKFTHSNPLFARVSKINVADMNLDGQVDLVLVSGWETGDLVIIHGQGNGTFVRDIRHSTGISDDYMAMEPPISSSLHPVH